MKFSKIEINVISKGKYVIWIPKQTAVDNGEIMIPTF